LKGIGVQSERYEWLLEFVHCLLPHPTTEHTVGMFTVIVSRHTLACNVRHSKQTNTTILLFDRLSVIRKKNPHDYPGLLGFWTLSIVWCSKVHNVSETASVSILRG
jgi:hypothetical protein